MIGPIVFIGSGSEWFWSMAQFVVVAATLIGLYHQVRLQRAANAFEHVQKLASEFNGEILARASLEVLEASSARKPIEVEARGSLAIVANYWDEIGTLVRAGHVDRRMAYETLGTSCQIWWAIVRDAAGGVRREMRIPRAWGNFEWLAGACSALDRETGNPVTYEPEGIAAIIPGYMRSIAERIRLAELARSTVTTTPARRRRATRDA